MMPLTVEDMAGIYESLAGMDMSKIVMSPLMARRIRVIVSKINRRRNRAMAMRRRRRIGRGRW